MQAVKRHLHRRIALDLDFEPLALGTEGPCRVQMLLTHEPVRANGHERHADDRRLPGEAMRRDATRWDRTDWRVDGLGSDGDLMAGGLVGGWADARLGGGP